MPRLTVLCLAVCVFFYAPTLSGDRQLWSQESAAESAVEGDIAVETPPPTAEKPPSAVEGFAKPALKLPEWAAHDINSTIDRLFREHGVEIAFPQRDLHLRTVSSDVVDAVQARRLSAINPR